MGPAQQGFGLPQGVLPEVRCVPQGVRGGGLALHILPYGHLCGDGTATFVAFHRQHVKAFEGELFGGHSSWASTAKLCKGCMQHDATHRNCKWAARTQQPAA